MLWYKYRYFSEYLKLLWLGISDEPYFHALNGLREHIQHIQFFIKKIFASFFNSSDADTGNSFHLKM